MSDELELSIDNFWELLDRGEYKKCHKLLDSSDYDISKISTMRVATFFRELRYREAYNFAFDDKNNCSNYIKGFTAFKHSCDTEVKNHIKYIEEAKSYLEEAIKNNELGFYNKVVAQTMLIDSYFILGDSEKSFSLAKSIVHEYYTLDKPSIIFNGKYQIYLIDAFNPKYSSEEKKRKLIQFFNYSKQERYKTFDDIIKYSKYLKYKPSDLIEAFTESNFSYEDGYLEYRLLEETSDEKEKKQLKHIWYWQFLILAQLMITGDSKIQEISHYTSQSTFDLLLQDDKKIAEFSLSNANDKIEGNVLTKILLDNNCIGTNVNTENVNQYIAVQTSYSRNKNSLTMFRLYGKKDGKEGTGISLTFDRKFFQINPINMNNNIDKTSEDVNIVIDSRKPLFWILYYNAERKILYFYPLEDELKPYIIDLNINIALKWNTYSSYKDKTEMKQRNLLYSFKRLFKAVKKCNNKELAVKVLYKLRYFIKSSDFAEEKELRMLDLCAPEALNVVNGTYKLYYEYKNIFEYDSLKSVIIGPKVDNKQGYCDYLKMFLAKRNNDIEVILSNAPLA